jgi:hypothetical protein
LGFIISRISGGALGIVLALAAFILQLLIRRVKFPALAVRIIATASTITAVYTAVITIQNLLKFPPRISSLITVSLPLLLYILGLAALFVLLFIRPQESRSIKTAHANGAVAIIAAVQFAFLLFNLIRNWNNFTRGMLEFLYIQILLLVITGITVLLFWLSYRASRKLFSFNRLLC